MPRDSKGSNEVRKTTQAKPRLVALFTTPEEKVFPRSSSSMSREELRVEDLDVTPLQFGTPVHRVNRPALNPERPNSNNAIDNAITSGKFTVYQGGDLNQFFGCDVFAPKRVSEVCLVNDHYILVKIPETPESTQQNKAQSEMAYKTLKTPPHQTISTLSNEPQPGKKFSRYLQCGNGRTSRVSPTPTASKRTDGSASANKPWSTDSCVEEVFKSRTILTGSINGNQSTSSTKVEKQDQASQTPDIKTPTVCAEMPSVLNTEESRKVSTVRSPLETSLKNLVELEMHGRLETPQGDINEIRKRTTSHMLPRPRRPFGLSFCWFLRSFRFRQSSKKAIKAKKKVNAVVYKTFFVTWTKPVDHSPCPNCCGIKPKLRRTRSAVF